MDESSRIKFAVQLTNCHLLNSGLPAYECSSDMDALSCSSALRESSIAFNAYTEFWLHTGHLLVTASAIYSLAPRCRFYLFLSARRKLSRAKR